jgi:Protein of unknown function (DUF1552)
MSNRSSTPVSRRRFLRGAGSVAVALPWLESLAGSSASAAAPQTPKRFVAFFQSCGVDISRFWPKTIGTITADGLTGTALEPLASYAGKLLIPRGIQCSPRGYNFDNAQNGANDHNLGTAARLTAAKLDSVNNQHYAQGISVDQEMAKSINPAGKSALTLAVGRESTGTADGYISYLGPGQPAPRQQNPWLVYQDFMSAGADPTPMVDLVLKRRQSVLDAVKVDFDRLKSSARLSQADKDKLDMHFSTIRDLEGGMVSSGAIGCSIPDATVTELKGVNNAQVRNDSQFRTIGRLQMDVMALALACGATNVATLMWGSGEGGPVFSWLGHTNEHHLISHRVVDYGSSTPLNGAIDLLHDIDKWYAGQFKYLLDKLSAYQEADGTLLDHSAVLWCNELSNGSIHHFQDLPFVIAGGAGGALKQGEYVKVTASKLATGPDDVTPGDDAPHNKLLTTLLNAVGATQGGQPYDNFGQYGGAGQFEQLLA